MRAEEKLEAAEKWEKYLKWNFISIFRCNNRKGWSLNCIFTPTLRDRQHLVQKIIQKLATESDEYFKLMKL